MSDLKCCLLQTSVELQILSIFTRRSCQTLWWKTFQSTFLQMHGSHVDVCFLFFVERQRQASVFFDPLAKHRNIANPVQRHWTQFQINGNAQESASRRCRFSVDLLFYNCWRCPLSVLVPTKGGNMFEIDRNFHLFFPSAQNTADQKDDDPCLCFISVVGRMLAFVLRDCPKILLWKVNTFDFSCLSRRWCCPNRIGFFVMLVEGGSLILPIVGDFDMKRRLTRLLLCCLWPPMVLIQMIQDMLLYSCPVFTSKLHVGSCSDLRLFVPRWNGDHHLTDGFTKYDVL